MFLRNQFKSVGMFKLPLVKKQEISLEKVKLIGYDKVNQSKDYDSIVHFFLDDYRFESIYNNPEPENNDNIDVPRYPGNDPAKQPGKDFEWRGKGEPASGKGAWVNPKTGETLHPDLNHGPPYGPHWDYNYPGGGKGVRIFPDGGILPKYFKGDVFYA